MEPSEPDISEVVSMGRQESEERGSRSHSRSPPPHPRSHDDDDDEEEDEDEDDDGDDGDEPECEDAELETPIANDSFVSSIFNAGSSDGMLHAPRTDRYPSCNSTESEYVSDPDDNSTIDDMSSASDALLPQGDLDPDSTEINTAHAFHMKPESKALLMRPEVLKLRKTSC